MARIRPIPGKPFPPLDEQACHFDSPAEPNNVHIEVRLPGHLQEEALRTATLAALSHEPRARLRMVACGGWRSMRWECASQLDVSPVSRVTWTCERDLDRIRERFLNEPVPLRVAPPVRVLLATGPAQDSVILKAHHAAADGITCLNLLRLVARHYCADPQQEPVPGSEAAAGHATPRHDSGQPGEVARQAGAAQSGAAAQRSGVARKAWRRDRTARLARLLAAPPARIASERNAGRRDAAGYGVVTMTCSPLPAAPRPLAPGTLTGPRPTVNDLLVATLIEAIRRWNAARDRPVRPVRISVPMNARPPGQADAAGNLSRLSTVTAPPDPRAGPADSAVLAASAGLVAEVSRQLAAAKGDPGRLAIRGGNRAIAACWPPAVRRAAVRAALRLAGRWVCDTSLLSNLGDVADPPRFGGASPESILFSTSAHMPRGLSVGAVTICGRLHLCFRYRHALFDEAAARQFAGDYAAALRDLAAEPLGTAALAALPAVAWRPDRYL